MSETPLEEVKPKKKSKKKVEPVVEVASEPVKEETWIDRLRAEKVELDVRIKTLYAVTRGDMTEVEPAHAELLNIQLLQMQAYSATLTKRLALLK
jgi:hypothetical protein